MKDMKFRVKKYQADTLSTLEYIRLCGDKNIKYFFVVQMRLLFFWITIKTFADEDEWYAETEAQELLYKLYEKV